MEFLWADKIQFLNLVSVIRQSINQLRDPLTREVELLQKNKTKPIIAKEYKVYWS